MPPHGGSVPLEVAIVHLADIICQPLSSVPAGNGISPLEPVAWDRLGLPSPTATILKQSETQIEEAFAILVRDDGAHGTYPLDRIPPGTRQFLEEAIAVTWPSSTCWHPAAISMAI